MNFSRDGGQEREVSFTSGSSPTNLEVSPSLAVLPTSLSLQNSGIPPAQNSLWAAIANTALSEPPHSQHTQMLPRGLHEVYGVLCRHHKPVWGIPIASSIRIKQHDHTSVLNTLGRYDLEQRVVVLWRTETVHLPNVKVGVLRRRQSGRGLGKSRKWGWHDGNAAYAHPLLLLRQSSKGPLLRFGDLYLCHREWVEDTQLWIQQVSSTPSTRMDVVHLQEQLDLKLQQRQARETGICPVRRELYSQCFGE